MNYDVNFYSSCTGKMTKIGQSYVWIMSLVFLAHSVYVKFHQFILSNKNVVLKRKTFQFSAAWCTVHDE